MIDYPFYTGQSLRDPTNSRLLTVVDMLGEGAYAFVYLVRESKSQKLYALKCLSKQGLTWEQLNLQRQEAKLHKMLKHRNVVFLERYFETKNWLYLVMEYCPGTDLFNWICERRDFYSGGHKRTEAERRSAIKDVFSQVLEAAAFCHQRGVFHRDLKPENFMVCADGTVKLTDFGLATTARTSDDFDCGSMPYMSFECRVETAETYSPRLSDIWSLGVLLLTLLYRRTPWAQAHLDCAEYARFVKDPTDFLERELGCELEIAQFLSRRVFCPASRRVSLEEFARRWREGLLLTAPIKVPRRSSPWRPQVSQLRQLLDQIHSSPSPQPQNNAKLSMSWGDMSDDAMDFSAPVVFDSESTDVEDDFGSPAESVATAVGSDYMQACAGKASRQKLEPPCGCEEEDIFAMVL